MKMVFWEVVRDGDDRERRMRVVADTVIPRPGEAETWAKLGARYFLDDDRELEPVEGNWKHMRFRAIGTDEIFVLKGRS